MISFNLICSEPVESKRACQTFCAFPQNQDTLRCGMYVELCACAIVCMAVLLIVKQLNNVCSCVFCGDINHLHRCLWRCFCRPFFFFWPVAGYETFLTQIRNRIVCAEDDVQEMVSQACDSMKDRRGPKSSWLVSST